MPTPRLLGQGSFGIVRLVFGSGQWYVEKEIKWEKTERGKQRQLREVQTMLGVKNHHNIIRILDYKPKRHTLVLHLEYMDGGSIQRCLKKQGCPLEEPLVRCYTSDILQGLCHLHEIGILHRDIKGENILLCSVGDGSYTAKIGDFGLAKIVAKDLWTAKHSGCGTLRYKSPELLSNEDYGRGSDVWALGCTVVEMLTMEPPWKDLKPNEIMIRLNENPLVVPLEMNISENAKTFLRKIFIKKTKRKYTKQLMNEPWVNLKAE